MQEETAKELNKAKNAFSVIMNELIQEDVMIIGTDYKIIDANETLLKKVGLKRDAIIGMHCYEISHHQADPCEGEHHPCPLREAVETGKPSLATHVHLDRNGRPRASIPYPAIRYTKMGKWWPWWNCPKILRKISISRRP